VIVRGNINGSLEFYLVIRPQVTNKKRKRGLFGLLNKIRALFRLINFSPLSLKEKSLYKITFLNIIKIGGGP